MDITTMDSFSILR